jgi:large repetitive protein
MHFGDAGNDCLDGGSSKDDFMGGDGDDTLIARDGGRDTGSGGPGPIGAGSTSRTPSPR